MKLIKTAIAAALLAGSFSANAAGIVDFFSTDQAQLVDSTLADGGLWSSVGAGDPSILGGNRDIYVELLARNAANPNGVAKIGVAGGALSFSTDSLTSGTGWVQWDGGANTDQTVNKTGLGGLNLSQYGNAFKVTTIFSDLGYEFVITAWTNATNWTSISFNATGVAAPTDSFIPLAAFENPLLCNSVNPAPGVNKITCSDAAGNGGGTQVASFANLGALELQIDPTGGTTSVDLTLDQVIVVPEPASVALLATALLAGGLVGRRRQK